MKEEEDVDDDWRERRDRDLIGYVITVEKVQTKISSRNFRTERILNIIPLYFNENECWAIDELAPNEEIIGVIPKAHQGRQSPTEAHYRAAPRATR